MKRTAQIAIAIATLVPAVTAFASDQDKSGKAGASFDALDTNRDGRISRTEASADASIVFAQVDANADGYIDTMEYAKTRKTSEGTSPTQPQPQSEATYPPNDASGQTEPVTPQDESTTPPSDTETPRQ